jgi:hypothetical protein
MMIVAPTGLTSRREKLPRMSRPTPKRYAQLFMLLLGSASMYFYWSHVPKNIDGVAPSVATRTRPLTDLYAQWYGTRELLLHHRDPYGEDVTRELQLAYYGKDVEPSEASHPSHQQRFAYPLYVALLLAPTVGMPFHVVQILFWWLLVAATAGSVSLWARALGLKLSPFNLAIALVVTFTSIPVMQGLEILQFGLLVGALLAAAAAATVSGYLFLAGVLLAIATIKPQMSILAIAWFTLWVSGDWHKRRSLLAGFGIALSALIVASEFLSPGWVMRFLLALIQYEKHMRTPSLLGVYLPAYLEWPTALLGFLIVTIYAWRARHEHSDAVSFSLYLALALALTLLIVPTAVQPFNHILLVPAALLVVSYRNALEQSDRLFRLMSAAICSVALLPWVSSVAVAIVLLMGPRRWLSTIWFLPLNATLALPLAGFAILFLLRTKISSQSTFSHPGDIGAVKAQP